MRPKQLPLLTPCAVRPLSQLAKGAMPPPPSSLVGGGGCLNVKYAVAILNASSACKHAGDPIWLLLVYSASLLCWVVGARPAPRHSGRYRAKVTSARPCELHVGAD